MTTATATLARTFTCSRCDEERPHPDGYGEPGYTGGTGYGTDPAGAMICYRCCGELDAAEMDRTGRAILYLSTEPCDRPGTIHWQCRGDVIVLRRRVDAHGHTVLTTGHATVSNWPGTLRLNVQRMTTGRHNLAGRRYDVWFTHNGARWHGTQYGDNTQIVRCRRLK